MITNTYQTFCGWASSFPQLFGFLGSGLIGAYVTKTRKYITTCKIVYAIGALTTLLMGEVRRATIYFQIVWIPTKLKNHRTSNDKKVFIVPDMTKAQLEADKKLNEELYRCRNNNERVIIRRGRIVNISGSPETNVA